MKKFTIVLIIIAAFIIGFFTGRFNTIHNAELIDYNQKWIYNCIQLGCT